MSECVSKARGHVMYVFHRKSTASILSSYFRHYLVCFSLGNSCTNFNETCFRSSMYVLEGYWN